MFSVTLRPMLQNVTLHLFRCFGHGCDKYAANGSKKYRIAHHTKDWKKKKATAKSAHREAKMVLLLKKKEESARINRKKTLKESLGIAKDSDPSLAQSVMDIDPNAYRFGISKELGSRLPGPIQQMLRFENASSREKIQQRQRQWLQKYGKDEHDFGDTAVQSMLHFVY